MIKSGDVVRVKNKETGEKIQARVVSVESNTEMIDVTYGGTTLGGPPPDPYRVFIPGKASTRITLEVIG